MNRILAVAWAFFMVSFIIYLFFYLALFNDLVASVLGGQLKIGSFYTINLDAMRSGYATMQDESLYVIIASFVLWFCVLALLIVSNKKVEAVSSFHVKEMHGSRTKTDIDSLYDTLKNKKRIKISAAAKFFNVSSSVVFEWGKILENGGLASIQYPKFGEPEIVLTEEKYAQEESAEKEEAF